MNIGVHMSKPHFSQSLGNFSVKTLYDMYKVGTLVLRPTLNGKKRSYQRMPWWKRSKKIYLIHSIFEGSTLLPVFIYIDAGVWNIVDGLQRLSTLFSYIDGEFRLSNAGMMENDVETLDEELEGCTWDKLSDESKDAIEGYNIRIESLVRPSRSMPIAQFEDRIRFVFHRINVTSGGMSEMEVKNSIFSGDLIDLLYDTQEAMGYKGLAATALSLRVKDVASDYYLYTSKVVNDNDVQRLQDLDLILQLLYMIDCINKKETAGPVDPGKLGSVSYAIPGEYRLVHKDDGVQQYCQDNRSITPDKTKALKVAFMTDLMYMYKLELCPGFTLAKTIYRKEHDFYSLFSAVESLRHEGVLTEDSDLSFAARNLADFSEAVELYKSCRTKKDMKAWLAHGVTAPVKKTVEDYYETRVRDWNTRGNRRIRLNTIRELVTRKRTIKTP